MAATDPLRSLAISKTYAPQRARLQLWNREKSLVSKIVLEGGTDVAEMVLFSVDEIPPERVSEEALAGLEANNQAIRMPTGRMAVTCCTCTSMSKCPTVSCSTALKMMR